MKSIIEKVVKYKILCLCLFLILCFVLLSVSLISCGDKYTEEEKAQIQTVFKSFNNSEDFVAISDGIIYLNEKVIDTNELDYMGNKFNYILGVEDDYCYLCYIVEESENNYAIHIITMFYDTLEMQEVACISHMKKDVMTWRTYEKEKIVFSNGGKYIFYDLITKEQRESENKDLSWLEEKRYSFCVADNWFGGCGKDFPSITIIDKQTNQQKTVSWENDVSSFEEGAYIKQLDNRFRGAPSTFIDGIEKDDKCYLIAWVPYGNMGIEGYQIVIFSYDFNQNMLNYYSSFEYLGYDYPLVEIIYR